METNKTNKEFSPLEQIISIASAFIRNEAIVYTGVGLATAAVFLAKLTHAPDATIIFESGIVRSDLCALPYGVDTIETQRGADMLSDVFYVNTLAQSGHIDLGIISAGQIDRYGNLNSTCIGPYENPSLRYPGSGGAIDIFSLCKETIVILPKHSKERLPERVSFVSSPGYIPPCSTNHKESGSTVSSGECHVITNLGVLKLTGGELILESKHSRIRFEDIKENTGWELKTADPLKDTVPPNEEALFLLRNQVDPNAILLSGMMTL